MSYVFNFLKLYFDSVPLIRYEEFISADPRDKYNFKPVRELQWAQFDKLIQFLLFIILHWRPSSPRNIEDIGQA